MGEVEYREGQLAAASGQGGDSDPYDATTEQSRAWCHGWQAETLKRMKRKETAQAAPEPKERT